jgi:hypothetical protein
VLRRFNEVRDDRRSRLIAARSALLAVAVALGLAVSAVPADAFLYWTSGSGKARANLDGNGVIDPLFNAPFSGFAGLAVGGGYVYWTASRAIGRATIDGCGANPAFIAATGPAGQDPIDVAVDRTHVYWTTGGGAIGRASVDGSTVNDSFIGGIEAVTVAVDANYIYWGNENAGTHSIGRAKLDGTEVNPDFISLANGSIRLAVDASHIYWDNPNHAIGRAKLDGSGANETFINVQGNPGNPHGIAVDASHIYWEHDLDAVGRANLDGMAVTPNFIASTNGVGGLAIDALGPGAEFCAAPSSLSFAAQTVNTGPSAPQTVTVTNNGTAPLHISDVGLAGADPSQFALANNTCSGAEVSPGGGTCTVAVTFSPTSTGPQSAILRFAHDATARPTDVTLAGTGTAADSGAGTAPTPTPSAPLNPMTGSPAPSGATAPAPAPPPATRDLATVLGLPSAKKCLSHRSLTIHVHAPVGERLKSFSVTLNRRRVPTKGTASLVSLKRLPKGAFTVQITEHTTTGETIRAQRTFHTCAAKRHNTRRPRR